MLASLKPKLVTFAIGAALIGEGLLTWYVVAMDGGTVLKILVWSAVNVGLIFCAELLFQGFYRVVKGAAYRNVEKVNLSEMFIEPHPFLSFTNKRNFKSAKTNIKARYPLHEAEEYYYPPVRTNNFGHLDGPLGDRAIEIPKPKDQIRVLCLGASTTGNYIGKDGVAYSYPMALEKCLQGKFPKQSIIVHNCGQGGWTSAEILINYILNLKDACPDVVVIYHAYNDLPVSLTPGFRSDYAHARQNLAASYYKYRLASYIPMLPLGVYNFMVQSLFPFLNPRFGVLDAVATGKVDLQGKFHGLATYERNLKSLLALCAADGTDVVLSTYASCMVDAIRNSRVHIKYREGLDQENEVLRRIAEAHAVPLVDNARLVKEDVRYFVDSVHFTPEGMRLIAENIGAEVAKLIERRTGGNAVTPRMDKVSDAIHLHPNV